MKTQIQSILVPLDGSPASEQAIAWATELAGKHQAEIALLRVVDHPSIFSVYDLQHLEAYYQEAEGLARKYLEDVRQRWFQTNSKIRTLQVVGIPAEMILLKARELKASLVVMTSHGRDGMTRWFLGSVAEKVARHAECPVFLVRP